MVADGPAPRRVKWVWKRRVDDWHFSLANADEDDNLIYDHVLGVLDDVAIFKSERTTVPRYTGSEGGSPPSLDEAENILNNPSIDIEMLRSYIQSWWQKGTDFYDYRGREQECSLIALAHATRIYKHLDKATINIETVKTPLHELAWAQQSLHLAPQESQRGHCSDKGPSGDKQTFSDTRQPDNAPSPDDITGINQLLQKPPHGFPCASNLPWPPREVLHPFSHIGAQTPAFPNDYGPEVFRGTSNEVPPAALGRVTGGRRHDHDSKGERQKRTHSPPLAESEDSAVDISLAVCFACIAMFETGEFNVHPASLRGVMALSTGDSIYVISDLVSDPVERTNRPPIIRVFGNLGRPEMAFLLPPSKPRLQDHDLSSWHLINHFPFDGKFEDHFSGTSLHLSFTDFEMPIDVGARGLRDTLAVLMESLVSINDKGRHLGDLDVMATIHSELLDIVSCCPHGQGSRKVQDSIPHGTSLDNLISVDSWDEFLDLPSASVVVRACGNWQARLAMATASVQRSKRTLVLPKKPCLDCLQTYQRSGGYEVIIA
ncbi:hypothetical protein B0T16DRAFT_491439 [Cercophora newfieldiana]|uniref:Uncharacterized protein n=1 Tax=Cercophora newfieldiana TaxID=92897 RepID=A0AA40CS50_9PEZI|nr:hypothetical protein B0T16DRAFT_491439 [Cercophora newfieldiana]